MKRGVLLPLAILVAGGVVACPMRAADPSRAKGDLVQTAVRVGTLTRFLIVLRAADQVELLRGSVPLTVFAPDDEAFEKLPAGTLDTLLKPENKGRLTALLTAHLFRGRSLRAEELPVSEKLLSVNASALPVTRGENGAVSVGGARIVRPDLAASNGTLHVIDKVLLPPAL